MELRDQGLSEPSLALDAQRDGLTGLPNRISFDHHLQQALRQARDRKKSLAVVAVDVDSLKNINHTYGHKIGDLLLQQIASRLASALGPRDFLARLGGDEFLLCWEVSEAAEVSTKALQRIESLTAAYHCGGHELY